MATLVWQDMTVQYHQVWLKTLSLRISADIPNMRSSKENATRHTGVDVHPPFGATINVRSDGEPLTVVVFIGNNVTPVALSSSESWQNPRNEFANKQSAPDLAHLDWDWDGIIDFRDSAFDVETFDETLAGQLLNHAGEHKVRIRWRYDHENLVSDPFGEPMAFREYLIINFD